MKFCLSLACAALCMAIVWYDNWLYEISLFGLLLACCIIDSYLERKKNGRG